MTRAEAEAHIVVGDFEPVFKALELARGIEEAARRVVMHSLLVSDHDVLCNAYDCQRLEGWLNLSVVSVKNLATAREETRTAQ